MAPKSSLRCLLLLSLMPVWHQDAANAAPSLAEAVKAADAKYLQAPDVEGRDDAPKIDDFRAAGEDRVG